ncbi:MAG: hypothetical protein LUD16_12245 [Lachnospiraceae bacterium]|nr:hypothetical protein [Lachnospiraceae bacterium]
MASSSCGRDMPLAGVASSSYGRDMPQSSIVGRGMSTIEDWGCGHPSLRMGYSPAGAVTKMPQP